MEHSRSWEDDSSPISQETSRTLWNPKVHYRVHNSLPLTPILGQINSIYALPSYFFKVYFNTSLPSAPKSNSEYLWNHGIALHLMCQTNMAQCHNGTYKL